MIGNFSGVTSEEKLEALDLALTSKSFARAGQLKVLLQYLCEKEMRGESESLSEYQIGVEALGLRSDYSPGEDATVRNRTFILRRKLEELYRDHPEAGIQVQISKGSYVPRFTRVELAKDQPETVAAFPPALTPLSQSRPLGLPHWVGFAAGVLATLVLGSAVLYFRDAPPRRDVPPAIEAAWGPLLQPDANVLVSIATAVQMVVRPAKNVSADDTATPVPPAVEALYRSWRPGTGSTPLYLYATRNAVGIGDATAATIAARQLTAGAATFRVSSDRLIPFASTRRRNVIVIGVPEDSETIRRLLEKAPFRLEHRYSNGDFLIREYAKGGQAGREFAAERDAHSQLTSVFGLVTVIPSEGSEGRQRTLIITRTHNAGAQAAMEFFTSPQSLRALLKTMGRRDFPDAYQVVIRASTDGTLPLSFAYAAHAILD